VSITLRVNEVERRLAVDPRTTLLDCLREHIYLTGTKKGDRPGRRCAGNRQRRLSRDGRARPRIADPD